MKTSATINQPGDVSCAHRRSVIKGNGVVVSSYREKTGQLLISSTRKWAEEGERAFYYIGQGRCGGLQSVVVLIRHPPTHLV